MGVAVLKHHLVGNFSEGRRKMKILIQDSRFLFAMELKCVVRSFVTCC